MRASLCKNAVSGYDHDLKKKCVQRADEMGYKKFFPPIVCTLAVIK